MTARDGGAMTAWEVELWSRARGRYQSTGQCFRTRANAGAWAERWRNRGRGARVVKKQWTYQPDLA